MLPVLFSGRRGCGANCKRYGRNCVSAERIADTGSWLRSVVQGYFNYHAVPGNFRALQTFRRELARAWLEALRRRSQRHRFPWERFCSILDRYLPLPRILHPESGARFDAKDPS
jgi:RNA-directed DNA polymerase